MRSYPELSEYELRTRLGTVAAEHEPDRAAMLDRIARDRPALPVADRPAAGPALRLAGTALAVATILGVSGVAHWALADGPAPGAVPAATPAPLPSSRLAPALRVDGSIDPTSNDITLKVREPLRALDLTVRVTPAAGLTDRGATHDIAGARITTTVVREDDTLVYRFTLAGGATLGEGTYVFSARYAHDNEGGRDAGDDTYRVLATTVDAAAHVDLRGGFS